MASQGISTPMGGTVIEPIPQRIPFVSIDRYATRMGISGERFDFFLRWISALDREFLRFSAEQSRSRWEKMQARSAG
jgi:hypothetical protein